MRWLRVCLCAIRGHRYLVQRTPTRIYEACLCGYERPGWTIT